MFKSFQHTINYLKRENSDLKIRIWELQKHISKNKAVISWLEKKRDKHISEQKFKKPEGGRN